MFIYKYYGALHLWWYLLSATNIRVLCTSDFDGKCLSTNIAVLCTFGFILPIRIVKLVKGMFYNSKALSQSSRAAKYL
jgi:hypothetical protein